jgi:putative membrane protein
MLSGQTSPAGAQPLRPPSYLWIGLASEFALFRRPKVVLATLALIFVPSLYVLIYVSSVWDPYGNLRQLPVALVNQDVPVTQAGHEVNLGGQVVETLETQKPFGFVRYANPASARAAVNSGEVFFAVLIPPDFSRSAVASDQPARLNIYVSEGGNFTASVLSRRFGLELAHTLNEKIGRERWAALVGEAGQPESVTLSRGLLALQKGGKQLADGVTKVRTGAGELHDGIGRAEAGADKLADGSVQLAQGASSLTGGLKQVEEAVATMRAKLPADHQLTELAQGSRDLAHGSAELKTGMDQLEQNLPRLEDGAKQLQEGSAKVPFFGGKLAAGTGQLRDGITTFGVGVKRATTGATQLNEGMNRLDPAIQPLTAGLIELNAGLATMAEKLPPTEQLDIFDRSMGQLRDGNVALATGFRELATGAGQLEAGAKDLEAGAGQLAAGLDEVETRFQAGFGEVHAGKLSAPVDVQVETTAPVPNNGPAFAPYFSTLSLWFGALMMSFIFHLRRLPDSMRLAPRAARWFCKAAALMVIGALQATVIVLVVGPLLGVHFAHPYEVWLVAVIGSLSFVCVVLFFISALGDAGRLLSVILLIFQLAASGGIYPIELSPMLYQKVHGYLPFTFLVRSFRATMFGAFDSHWLGPIGQLGLVAGGMIILSILFAKWKYVPRESYGPAVEF